MDQRKRRSEVEGLVSSVLAILVIVMIGVPSAKAAQDLDGLRIVVLEGETA